MLPSPAVIEMNLCIPSGDCFLMDHAGNMLGQHSHQHVPSPRSFLRPPPPSQLGPFLPHTRKGGREDPPSFPRFQNLPKCGCLRLKQKLPSAKISFHTAFLVEFSPAGSHGFLERDPAVHGYSSRGWHTSLLITCDLPPSYYWVGAGVSTNAFLPVSSSLVCAGKPQWSCSISVQSQALYRDV